MTLFIYSFSSLWASKFHVVKLRRASVLSVTHITHMTNVGQ